MSGVVYRVLYDTTGQVPLFLAELFAAIPRLVRLRLRGDKDVWRDYPVPTLLSGRTTWTE